MARKGENIYKRKDKRWECRYIKGHQTTGKTVYGYIYGKSYAEVKQKKMEVMLSLQIKQQDQAKQQEALQKKEALERLADEWFSFVSQQIKESSSVKYYSMLQLHILPEFKDTELTEITPDNVSDFVRHLMTEGSAKNEPLAPKTTADILSVLRRLFAFAQKKGIPLQTDGKEIVVRQKQLELIIFTKEEQACLCKYLTENLTERSFGILIGFCTGMRLGEICALRWEDISLSEGTLHVSRTMQRLKTRDGGEAKTRVVVTEPKSPSSIRTIPLTEEVIDMIVTHFPNREGYVLARPGQKWVEPRNLEYYFSQTLKKLNIEHKNFHTIRHTFASRCVEIGIDIKTLSDILGHSNVGITMNRYVHPSMELKKESMQRLYDSFEKL